MRINNNLVMVGCTIAVCLVLAGLFIPPFTVHRVIDKANALVSYDFEQLQILDIYDKSGNSHDGNLVHAQWNLTTSLFGNCIYLDNNDDYIQIPYVSGLTLKDSPFTLVAWAYPINTATEQCIMSQRPTSFGWIFSIQTSGYVNFYDGGGWGTDSDTSVNINAWNFICFSFNGTHEKWYINGTFDNEYAGNGVTGTYNYDITVGRRMGGATYFYGYLDNVQIFLSALSGLQINDLWRNGFDTFKTVQEHLIYWYSGITFPVIALFFAFVVSITLILLVVHRGIKKITRR